MAAAVARSPCSLGSSASDTFLYPSPPASPQTRCGTSGNHTGQLFPLPSDFPMARRRKQPLKRTISESSILRMLERIRAFGYSNDVAEEVQKHFSTLPARYAVNIDPNRHEDVLMHMKLIKAARETEMRVLTSRNDSIPVPQIHVRKVQLLGTPDSPTGQAKPVSTTSSSKPVPIPKGPMRPTFGSQGNLSLLGSSPAGRRVSGCSPLSGSPLQRRGLGGTPPLPLHRPTFGSHSNLASLDADLQEKGHNAHNVGPMYGHEITVAGPDRHGLMKYLTSALSESALELNIREAHVFSTTDGMALEVFVVEGWTDEAEELEEAFLAAFSQRTAEAMQSEDEPAHAATAAPKGSGEDHLASLQDLKAAAAAISCEDWAVDFEKLEIGDRLGGGSSGRLYRGKYKGQDVAVKVISLDECGQGSSSSGTLRIAPAAELIQMFKQEVSIMRIVRHKNLVQFIGACSSWPKLCIVTELMAGGSVRDVMQKRNGGLEPAAALKVLRDTARGMDFLHKRGVVHRDLKAANLLIDEHDVVKVCDFGVARVKPGAKHQDKQIDTGSKASEMTAETGTYRWMAPEVLEHRPYDHKADVYSFGIVIWELLTGEIPYAGLTPLQAAIGVVQRQLRPVFPPGTPPKLVALADTCWATDPAQRPEFADILATLEDCMKTPSVWRKSFSFGKKK